MPNPRPLVQGTLDLLILKALASQELRTAWVYPGGSLTSRAERFRSSPSLFPALHRLEEAGWLSSTWGSSENKRRANDDYRLTTAGRRQLDQEQQGYWNRISLAITRARSVKELGHGVPCLDR